MSDTYEKNSISHDEKEPPIVETKVVTGTGTFNEALFREPPKPLSKASIILFLSSMVGFLCSTMNGYDGSLYNALLSNETFLETFGGENSGAWAGIVTSMYQIGCLVALPFVGPINDKYGRRMGMFIGCAFVIAGTICSSTTWNGNIDQFMGGRFLLGFGVSIASAAGPMFVIEISHPSYRGVVTAFFNTFWFTGSILAAGSSRGAVNLTGNITWLIPTWLQMVFPGIIVVFVWFLPESPRWMYVNNKADQAKAMLTKYHGEGNPESAWVKLQLSEYAANLDMDGADKRWWDYRALFKDKYARYRLFCCCLIGVFGQFAGNGLVSYFMSSVLDSAGISGTIPQGNMILINSCQQFAFAILGSTLVDRVGRRPLLLFSNAACCLTWICVTVTSSEFAKHGGTADDPGTSPQSGTACLVFIFIFGALFSIGFTPLQALYPVEVLSFEQRAKGMAFQTFSMNCAMLINNYALPIAMANIAWKTYIVFCIWCAVQTVIVYFVLPETKNRTLEELDEIFLSDSPVKASLEKKKIDVDAYGDVVDIRGAA